MNKLTIFTDGSSRGNPGPGGWGTIVVSGDRVIEFGGKENHTTNNRMELKSVIEGLNAIHSEEVKEALSPTITVYSDSQYVIKGITEWIHGWIMKGWKNSQKKAVLNRDLWEELIRASQNKKIVWKFVKGHADNIGNIRCDEIATRCADGENTELYNGSREGYPFKEILKNL